MAHDEYYIPYTEDDMRGMIEAGIGSDHPAVRKLGAMLEQVLNERNEAQQLAYHLVLPPPPVQ